MPAPGDNRAFGTVAKVVRALGLEMTFRPRSGGSPNPAAVAGLRWKQSGNTRLHKAK
jgi:hypothetical protein